MHKSQIGKLAEHEAARYLKSHGLTVVGENFSCKLGEIDLIMTAGKRTLVFIEVRYRRDQAFGSALDTVTASKQSKLRRTAAYFLQTHPRYQHFNCRFDVVGINSKHPGAGQIVWIPNAFS